MESYSELINRSCNIIPFEMLHGTIIAVFITKKGVEYRNRIDIDEMYRELR